MSKIQKEKNKDKVSITNHYRNHKDLYIYIYIKLLSVEALCIILLNNCYIRNLKF